MMTNMICESDAEEAVLEILTELGYKTIYGPDIAPDGPRPERTSYTTVLLIERLKHAIAKLNPDIPADAREDAVKKLMRSDAPGLVLSNRQFHKFLSEGINVEFRRKDGTIAGDQVRLFDFEEPSNNEFLAVNQFTVIEGNYNRRPDVTIFVNGLPLAIIELKNPADEKATIWNAFNQLQTYKKEIPSIFHFNEILVISDGLEARAGTLTADKERFMPWKTADGKGIAPATIPQIQVLLEGMFEKARLLDIVHHFIVFEEEEKIIAKKLAGYHQYHAVNKAIEKTLKASSAQGDRRCGVIWHTQGSGKSLTMVFYTGKLVQILNNPTVVMLTDRNDLDDQLFGTFSRCKDVFRQTPLQAEERSDLRKLLAVASGGVVFTTIQKFMPEQKGDKYPVLSDRKNIIVIADEAHRSQYDFIDGFARHMRDALPHASFIGFTGTPIEKTDRNTPAVFGDYIDIYDIEQAVIDGATVRIYYEGRLAKLELKASERPRIDPDFEEVTEGEEADKKEKLKRKWAATEKMVGTEKRIGLIAKDIVSHFEQRLDTMDGKGMIVCMSRRICVDLHDAIVKLRPQWYSDDDKKGFIKVVMTGSAGDPPEWQEHIRNKKKREELANRMKDAKSPLRLVIVRDMWLTGFDVPSLHSMYVDKPMRGHGLMQAIARVNRVFKDKPGGLVVDYIGIADQLKKALADYTERDREQTGIPQEEAVAVMLEKYEIAQAMFHEFDYSLFFTGTAKQKLAVLPAAMDFILKQKDGKKRFVQAVVELSKAFALSVPHPEAIKIRDDVGFFQAVRSGLTKATVEGGKTEEQLDTAIRQIISKAVASDQIIDIFDAAGLKKPDISILSDEFLAEVKNMPYKNLAMELLKKLLNDEIKAKSKHNLVQARSFAEMLEKTIIRYQNRSLETAQILDELIGLAKEMREAAKRGEKLNLSEDELAFYDALEVNDSAVKILGDDTLRTIARELVETVKKNVTIDWNLRDSARANIRAMVKRILRKHGYPPDKQETATDTVIKQTELLCTHWSN